MNSKMENVGDKALSMDFAVQIFMLAARVGWLWWAWNCFAAGVLGAPSVGPAQAAALYVLVRILAHSVTRGQKGAE